MPLHNIQSALVLNVDDYHNIHVQRQPDTTDTSWAAHMATILANPCPMPAISRYGALNPKVVDSELIAQHLDRRFIVNLGVSYHDHMQDHRTKEYPDEELIDKLTLHSYNDRVTSSYRHVRDSILFDFVENQLKEIDGYLRALQSVYEKSSNVIEDDISEAEEVKDDTVVTANLLEHAKQSFTQL